MKRQKHDILPRLTIVPKPSNSLRLAYDDFLLSREVMRCSDKTLIHYRYSFLHFEEMMVDSGLRLAETCALTWGDIDAKSGIVRVVRGKGVKPEAWSSERRRGAPSSPTGAGAYNCWVASSRTATGGVAKPQDA